MKTVILLHGLRGSHLALEAVSEQLKNAGYRTVTPDLPGTGESAPLKDQTLSGYVEWLHSLILSLMLPEKPVLLGHSMGSIIASHHAEKYPEDTDGRLILMSPVFREAAAREKNLRLNLRMERIISMLPQNLGKDVLKSKAVSYCVSRYLTADRSQQRRIDRQHAEFSGRMVSADAFLSDARIAMREQSVIPRNKQVLLIIGEKDKLVPAACVRRVAEETGARLVMIPNAGHLINYEQPKAAAEAAAEFLGF